MKIHRFIDPEFNLRQEEVNIANPRIVHQIQKVLRMQKGDKVVLGDGRGLEAKVELKGFGNKEIMAQVEERFENTREPQTEVTLYISVLKKDKMEWLAEKVTEVGVKKIVPITSERTVKLNLRYDRLQKIVTEAAEQSGRGVIPEIGDKISLEEAIDEAKNERDVNFFFHPEGDEAEFDSQVREQGKIGVFVGPEGGWSEQEAGLAYNKDLSIVKMGDLTLRGETAGIMASYLSFYIKFT